MSGGDRDRRTIRSMNLKAIGQTVLTIVLVLAGLKFIKPYLPAAISNFLP